MIDHILYAASQNFRHITKRHWSLFRSVQIGPTVVVGVQCVACEAGGMNGCDDTFHNIENARSVFVQVPSFIARLFGQYCIIENTASVRLQSTQSTGL